MTAVVAALRSDPKPQAGTTGAGSQGEGQTGTGTGSGAGSAGSGTAAQSGASVVTPFTVPTSAPTGAGIAGTLATPGLPPAAEATLPGQIIQSIQTQWQNGVGQATVTLNPEYLGTVTVSLRVEQGVVMAHLQADTPQVRSWIEAHAQDLQSALSTQGLQLGRLAVTPTNPDTPRRRQPSSRQQPSRPQTGAAPAAGAPVFEVRA